MNTKMLFAWGAVAWSLLVAPSGRAGEPTRRFELDGHRLELPGPILFATASDDLLPASEPALRYVKEYLDAKVDITTLRIEVHSDNLGDAAMNQALSQRRALVIARALVAKGVECTRVLPTGFGGTKPIVPNDSPENRAKNRRTAFVNAALRGHPIGGMPLDGGGKVAGDPCR